MAEAIRCTSRCDLETNLEFHYVLMNWFINENINARHTTRPR